MDVKTYADEMGVSVSKILEKCKELGLNPSKESDLLDDEDIIILDNELMNEKEEESTIDSELEEKFDLQERAEQMIEDSNLNQEEPRKKVKIKKKNDKKEKNNEEYLKEKKEIYKKIWR